MNQQRTAKPHTSQFIFYVLPLYINREHTTAKTKVKEVFSGHELWFIFTVTGITINTHWQVREHEATRFQSHYLDSLMKVGNNQKETLFTICEKHWEICNRQQVLL